MRASALALALVMASVLALPACSDVQEFETAGALAAPEAPGTSLPATAPVCGSTDDPNNCGACGRSCGGGACLRGVCQPYTLAEGYGIDPADERGAEQGVFGVATDDTYLWFMTAWSELYRLALDGGEAKPTLLGRPRATPDRLVLRRGHLYVQSTDEAPIARIPAAGGPAEPLIPAARSTDDYLGGFALDGDGIVWTVSNGKVLRCASVPCTSPVVLDSGREGHHRHAVTTSRGSVFAAYFQDSPTGGQTFGIDAVTRGGIVSTLSIMYYGLLAEPSKDDDRFEVVYGIGQHAIVRAMYPGGQPARVLASGDGLDEYPRDVTIDGDYLYWVNGTICPGVECRDPWGNVMRVRKDGAEPAEVVADKLPRLHNLAVGRATLYFTTADGKVLALAKPPPGRIVPR